MEMTFGQFKGIMVKTFHGTVRALLNVGAIPNIRSAASKTVREYSVLAYEM